MKEVEEKKKFCFHENLSQNCISAWLRFNMKSSKNMNKMEPDIRKWKNTPGQNEAYSMP